MPQAGEQHEPTSGANNCLPLASLNAPAKSEVSPQPCGFSHMKGSQPPTDTWDTTPHTFMPLLVTSDIPAEARPATGLLLTGGGAPAAYQGGVLEAIADPPQACGEGSGPCPIRPGAAAGAISAAALACGADNFDRAVRRIARVWRQFHASQVYGADSLSVMRSGARWLTLVSLGWALARWRRMRPKSLLDNTPLEKLLVKMVPLVRLPRLIRKGHLTALAVTASRCPLRI